MNNITGEQILAEMLALKEENERLREALRWRDMKEELPPLETHVLCRSEKGWCDVDRLIQLTVSDGGGGVEMVCNYVHSYTHWLPIPEVKE